MKKEKFDFGGWATKNDLLCADGRTIRKDAFKDDDGRTVPLVYQHNHEDPTRVIGHALLENRSEGVYAYGSLNRTDIAQHVKELIRHGDINGLSIFANKLTQRGGDVIHGTIRELSVVLAGANPGAVIEFPILEHGEESETEAYIWPGDEDGLDMGDGMKISHAEEESDNEEEPVEETPQQEEISEEKTEETVEHADDKSTETEISHADDDETVQDVLNTLDDTQKKIVDKAIDSILSGDEKELPDEDIKVLKTLNEKQQKVFTYLLEQAAEVVDSGDDEEDDEENKEASHSDEEGEDFTMKENVFDKSTMTEQNDTLTHAQMETIIKDAKKLGSLKQSVLEHSAEYGIEQIDYLMPEYREVNGGAPAFIKRDTTGWVNVVMNGVHHTPFSRIKTTFADITADEARARGYIKGRRKKEEVFSLLKRPTSATTVYKKQKLDRDDMIEITSFDVVAWLKSEMRMLLDEEIARAILIGDGRSPDLDDHIDENCIRPITKEDELFVVRKLLTAVQDEPIAKTLVKTVTKAWGEYQGSGNCVAFMTRDMLSELKLLEDRIGHFMYGTEDAIASALGVRKIVCVPQMSDANAVRIEGEDEEETSYAPVVVIVDLNDYNVGADKGGSVNMFDDFDIDYNQMKYLIETRCSGALVKPYSAIVIEQLVEEEEEEEEDDQQGGGGT